jgi:hypothetical protein
VPVQKHQISAAKTKKEPWDRRLPVKKKKNEAAKRPSAAPPQKKRIKKNGGRAGSARRPLQKH